MGGIMSLFITLSFTLLVSVLLWFLQIRLLHIVYVGIAITQLYVHVCAYMHVCMHACAMCVYVTCYVPQLQANGSSAVPV